MRNLEMLYVMAMSTTVPVLALHFLELAAMIGFMGASRYLFLKQIWLKVDWFMRWNYLF
jgi:hypothetical protein